MVNKDYFDNIFLLLINFVINAINLVINLYELIEKTISKKNIKAICKFIPTKLKKEY